MTEYYEHAGIIYLTTVQLETHSLTEDTLAAVANGIDLFESSFVAYQHVSDD